MQVSKQIEINQRLMNALKEQGLIINKYGESYVLCENPKHPDVFLYLQIGDWVAPHTANIYRKLNCYEKQQLSYQFELGYGETIEHLVAFATNPDTSKCHAKKDSEKIYLTNLNTSVHSDGTNQWVVPNISIQNDLQKMVLKTLKHIEMLQTETNWAVPRDSRTHTILRFQNESAYFDYDCDQYQIIQDGLLINIH